MYNNLYLISSLGEKTLSAVAKSTLFRYKCFLSYNKGILSLVLRGIDLIVGVMLVLFVLLLVLMVFIALSKKTLFKSSGEVENLCKN